MDVSTLLAYLKKEEFTSNGTFTAKVSGLYVILGCGGGGGGSSGTTGGSGAQMGIQVVWLDEGDTASVTIGAGGNGGTGGGNGSNGSDSVFGSLHFKPGIGGRSSDPSVNEASDVDYLYIPGHGGR